MSKRGKPHDSASAGLASCAGKQAVLREKADYVLSIRLLCSAQIHARVQPQTGGSRIGPAQPTSFLACTNCHPLGPVCLLSEEVG